jgi:hypothetical protein
MVLQRGRRIDAFLAAALPQPERKSTANPGSDIGPVPVAPIQNLSGKLLAGLDPLFHQLRHLPTLCIFSCGAGRYMDAYGSTCCMSEQ